jgi:hypothetical protein
VRSGRAADYHQEGLGVGRVAPDVLHLQVVPEIALVVPAVLAGTDDVALPGGEVG